MLYIISFIYGVSMKIADLLDEHGLNRGYFTKILFGFIRGICGGLLIYFGNNFIATFVLSMVLSFIVRNKIDYLNHQIGATIVIIIFLLFQKFNFELGLLSYFGFLVFGSLRDHIGDKIDLNNLKKRSKNLLNLLDNRLLHYYILAIILGYCYGEINNVLILSVSYFSYCLTKYIFKKRGYV